MLNVARLNVKAQKLHPDGSPDVTGEKGVQKIANGRTLRSSKPKGIPPFYSIFVSMFILLNLLYFLNKF